MNLSRWCSTLAWAGVTTAALLGLGRSAAAQQPAQTDTAALRRKYELRQREKLGPKLANERKRQAIEAERRAIAQRIAPVRHELDSLLAACAQRNLPTDYERMVATLLLDAPEWGGYTPEVDSAAQAAIGRLRAYLAGTATPLAVPRYVTQKVKVHGGDFLGAARYADGRVVSNRPLYLIGYGHGYMVYPDIKRFAGYGNNLIQAATTGPANGVFEAGAPDWKVANPVPVTDSRVWFRLDSTMAHTGRRSMVAHNHLDSGTVAVYFRLALERGAKYRVSAWVKGKDVFGASLELRPWLGIYHDSLGSSADTTLPMGSYDWRQIELSFTASSEFMDIWFELGGPADQLWLDDIKVTPLSTGPAAAGAKNLVPNGSFEWVPPVAPGATFYASATQFTAEFLPYMREAEAHNIAVDVLLAPHFFPEWPSQRWPGFQHSSGFLQFNVMDPRGRAILAAHLKMFIPLIKDFKSLHSISLSNEPEYEPARDTVDAEQWHTYLQKVYGDMGRLNQTYGTTYTTFTVVPMPRDNDKSAAGYDWKIFNDIRFAEWHQWMADLVHSMAPNVPLHVKLLSQGNYIHPGTDPERFAAFSQIHGDDNWSGNSPTTMLRYTQVYDFQRSIKPAPIFDSEAHLEGSYTPAGVWLALWQGAVHGRNAAAIWIWDAGVEERYRRHPDFILAIGRATLDLNRLAPEVAAVRDVPAKVAVLFSQPSKFYPVVPHTSVLSQVYALLSQRGRPVTFVTEQQLAAGTLDKLERDVVLVLPSTVQVYPSTLAAITQFAKRGGRVVALGDSVLTRDEHDRPLPAVEVRRTLGTALRVSLPPPLPAEAPKTAADSAAITTIRAQRVAFEQTVLQHFDTLVPSRVMLIDSTTQQPVQGFEWRAASVGQKLVINVANYTDRTVSVILVVDGRKVACATELISGTVMGPTIVAKSMSAYLFEVTESCGATPRH